MRKAIVFVVSLSVAAPLFAQQRSGTIHGKVVDGSGAALRGVSVTLAGSPTVPLGTKTNRRGEFRFLGLHPGSDYVLRAEHPNFKTTILENLAIAVSGEVDVVIPMEQGAPDESARLGAENPVVGARWTSVGANITLAMLQSLPSARDPWDVVKMAPAVVTSQENVGGIFAGQMADAFARAGDEGGTSWTLDGVVVSDPTSVGRPSTSWDFDLFEEIHVTSGGGGVTQQTPGIQINLVSRRGGNKPHFGGRFFLIDSKLQGDTFTSDLASEGLAGINKFDELRDFGFNFSLPFLKNKIRFWGSYGVQDLQAFTVYGNPESSLVSSLAAKVNVQLIPQNRLELFAQGSRTVRRGRDQWYANPEGLLERPISHLGFPVLQIQDEHAFGNNLFLSLRWGVHNGGYELTPMRDPELESIAIWDQGDNRFYGAHYLYRIDNWTTNTSAQATFFVGEFFGASHEFKLGFELSDRSKQRSEDRTPGNVTVTGNFIYPQADFDGDGAPDVPEDESFRFVSFERGFKDYQGVRAWAAFFSDTLSFGRFNLTVGLRYDYQHPLTRTLTVEAVEETAPQWSRYFATNAISRLKVLLPAVTVPGRSASASDGTKYAWKDFQPRLSLTYDVTGDGRTIATLAFSRYGSWMGTKEASRWRRNAGGWMGFYWWDTDLNNVVSTSELYWYTIADYALYPVFSGDTFVGNWEDAAGVFWGGFDYTEPSELEALYSSIQPDAQSPHTSEVVLSLEREIRPDLGIQISGTFRRYSDFVWDLKYFPETGVVQNPGWYEEANPVPADIPDFGSTGEAANHPWYYVNAEGTAYSPWVNGLVRPDYHEDYWSVDVVLNKRLSDKWMFNGSLTLQDSSRKYGETGLMDQTNRWAFEGRPTSSSFVKCIIKLSGLYQFPYGISASFSYQGRQGWIIAESFKIVDYTLPNNLSNSATLLMAPYGSERLPFLHKLDLHLEKMFKLGETGRITAMIDIFNALNSATPIRRAEKFRGTYFIHEDPELNTWVANPSSYQLEQILNPLVVRLGARFQF